MLRKRLLARMCRLHKTYIHDRTGAFEAKPARPWGRTVEFEFTINAVVLCLFIEWVISVPQHQDHIPEMSFLRP